MVLLIVSHHDIKSQCSFRLAGVNAFGTNGEDS
jgi:hypothetical protein